MKQLKKWHSLLVAFLLMIVVTGCNFSGSATKPILNLSGFPFLSKGMDIQIVTVSGDTQDISKVLGKVPQDLSEVTVTASLKKNTDFFAVCLTSGNNIEYTIIIEPGRVEYDITGYWQHNRNPKRTLDSLYGVRVSDFENASLNSGGLLKFDDAPFYYFTLNNVKGKKIFINALDSNNVHVSYTYDKDVYLKETPDKATEVKTGDYRSLGFEAKENTVYVGVLPLSYAAMFASNPTPTYVDLSFIDVTEESKLYGNIDLITSSTKGDVYYTKGSDNIIYKTNSKNDISKYLEFLSGLPITQIQGDGDKLYVAAKDQFYIYDTTTKRQVQKTIPGNITSFTVKDDRAYFFYKKNETDTKYIFRVLDLTNNKAVEVENVDGGTDLTIALDWKPNKNLVIFRTENTSQYGYLFWEETAGSITNNVGGVPSRNLITDKNYIYYPDRNLLFSGNCIGSFLLGVDNSANFDFSKGSFDIASISIPGYAIGTFKDNTLYAVVKTDNDAYVIRKYDMSGTPKKVGSDSRKIYNINPRHIFIDNNGNVNLVANSSISIFDDCYPISVFTLDCDLKEIEDGSRSAGKPGNIYYKKGNPVILGF